MPNHIQDERIKSTSMNFPLTFAAIEECESVQALRQQGYRPITVSYRPTEWRKLENALRSLANGKRRYKLAIRPDGHEIHIPGTDYREAPKHK